MFSRESVPRTDTLRQGDNMAKVMNAAVTVMRTKARRADKLLFFSHSLSPSHYSFLPLPSPPFPSCHRLSLSSLSKDQTR